MLGSHWERVQKNKKKRMRGKARACLRVEHEPGFANSIYSVFIDRYRNLQKNTQSSIIKYLSKNLDKIKVIEKNIDNNHKEFLDFCYMKIKPMTVFSACSWVIHRAAPEFMGDDIYF